MRLTFIAVFCTCLLDCAGIIPKDDPSVVLEDGNYFGTLNKSLIEGREAYTWFSKQYDAYLPDKKVLDKAKLQRVSIKVFMGTWCHDSRREVPRFYKILDQLNFDYDNFEIIGLTKDKKGRFRDYSDFRITNTPTFIFYRGDIEVGRIIESRKDHWNPTCRKY